MMASVMGQNLRNLLVTSMPSCPTRVRLHRHQCTLQNHRDPDPEHLRLTAIFGWVTDKEPNRYTRDFNRGAEAALS